MLYCINAKAPKLRLKGSNERTENSIVTPLVLRKYVIPQIESQKEKIVFCPFSVLVFVNDGNRLLLRPHNSKNR